MSKHTDSSFRIASSVPGLYQHLLSGIAGYEKLGSRVLREIETAHAFRQVERVRELAKILLNSPIREHQLIGQYYLVWCKCRESEYQSRELERIAEQTNTYKAKALISRGTFDLYQGNPEKALYFYNEGLKTSPTISEYIGLSIAIAAAKGEEGFHRTAIADMESIIPIIEHAEPRLYYDFLNSYAVELIEVGRLEQAETLSAIAVSSPFGPFYGEWQETYLESRSKRKQRSIITIGPPKIEAEYQLEGERPEISKARVQTAIDFMETNYHRPIAVDELSAMVNLSLGYFISLFKAEIGITPLAYLIRLRMKRASQLLKTSFKSIKQVMAAVGYNNKGNFARHFKRQFEATPSEYRDRFFHR